MRTHDEAMELYNEHEKYIAATAYKRFGHLNKQHKDEILQHGRLGLHKACQEYDSSKNTSFKTFAISNIYWAISDGLKQENPVSKLNCISLDQTIPEDFEESSTLHDVVEDTQAFEEVRKVEIDEKINLIKEVVSPRAFEIIDMCIQGYNHREIAKKLDITPQRVGRVLKDNRSRIESVLFG